MHSYVYESWLGLIMPEICPRCRKATGRGFCRACRRDFVPHSPRSDESGPDLPCSIAGHPGGSWQTDGLAVPYRYCDPLDLYVQALKYRGQRQLGRAFGLLLAEAVYARRAAIDALVPVPLHRRRQRERGYNQALEIARTVAHELRLPILCAKITRIKRTAPQSELGAAARIRNLAEAFDVRRNLAGARLAIVDDVVTTGATLNCLARALRDAGATYIEGWAIARTLPVESPIHEEKAG
jgi:ComF family protein